MKPLTSAKTNNRNFQDSTLRKCEPDNYKTILNLQCPVLDRMDENRHRIREAGESLEVLYIFLQNMTWECLLCHRKHKSRFQAQDCHHFFVRIVEVGKE